jgi:formylglycine-generating enzyme required for sulfatase activity
VYACKWLQSPLARLEVMAAGMRLRFLPAVGLAFAGLIAAGAAWVVSQRGGSEAPCGSGFARHGARCLVPEDACPRPFERVPSGCAPPDRTVSIPAATVAVGPSDWEAAGQASSRIVHVQAFRIDAFEITRGQWGGSRDDPFRAASGMTRAEAARYCEARGGRLPTEDEWTIAAMSAAVPPRRYPWGDTGAVCRRAAWGLEHGPCTVGAVAPDTVGAHADGDTPLGLHDMAGNVAEWVQVGPVGGLAEPGAGDVEIAKGGSWQTALATDLRVWARVELAPGARSDAVGLRCAYPP